MKMRYRKTLSLVLASIFAFAGAALIQAHEAEKPETSQAQKVSPSRLITKDSAGPVRIGMTVAQARKALPKLKFARTMDGEGMALIEVKNGETLEMILYAGEENPESPINEQAKIEFISVFGETYKTAEGIHPGMPLREVEKRYGKLISITMSEIESREYVEFSRPPAGLSFRAGLPEIGVAGVYPEGKRETKTYVPSSVVSIIEIYGN